MRVLTFVSMALVTLSANTAAAAASCCDEGKCCAKAVCKHHTADVALEPMVTGPAAIAPGLDWPAEARPVREYARVLFRDPVRIGGRMLIGPYVIEHDEDRMARGLPCTHIYAADNLRLPVVAFHCRHVDRTPSPNATVTLRRLSDPSIRMFELVKFQFEKSTEGHGVPDRW
jgi:hypothetical protein